LILVVLARETLTEFEAWGEVALDLAEIFADTALKFSHNDLQVLVHIQQYIIRW
jgi:hypothetical protein